MSLNQLFLLQILAMLTSGEGNHNFHHAFPSDFANGKHDLDWDPTKWIIWYVIQLLLPDSKALAQRMDVLNISGHYIISLPSSPQ